MKVWGGISGFSLAVALFCAATDSTSTAAPVALTVTSGSLTYEGSVDATGLGFGSDSGSQTVDLNGTLSVDVEVSGGSVSNLAFIASDVTADTINLAYSQLSIFPSPSFTIEFLEIGLDTPGGAPGPAVAAGQFDMADHDIRFVDASVSLVNFLGLTTTLDFPEDSQAALVLPTDPLLGTGTVSLTPLGGNDYQLSVFVPIEDDETFNESGVTASRTISGGFTAVGVITVPEPSSLILLLLGACGLAFVSRRKLQKS